MCLPDGDTCRGRAERGGGPGLCYLPGLDALWLAAPDSTVPKLVICSHVQGQPPPEVEGGLTGTGQAAYVCMNCWHWQAQGCEHTTSSVCLGITF